MLSIALLETSKKLKDIDGFLVIELKLKEDFQRIPNVRVTRIKIS